MNPPNPMTFGFLDQSSYDINGQQVKPPIVAPAPALPTQSPMALPAQAPTPAAPSAYTPPPMPDLSGFEKAYQANLLPTADENQAQTEMNNLQASSQMGINNIRSQPIPMDIIRGFSQNILENTETQKQTLQQRLATLQAKRQAALESSRFSLERADKQASMLREDSLRQADVTRKDARYKVEQERQQAQTQQKSQLDYANDIRQQNKISMPFYKNLGSDQVYDSRTGEAVDYNEYKRRGGVGVPGAAFPDVQEIKHEEPDKLLSPTEAARLGVPYGTTQKQAASRNITPSFGKASSGRSTSTAKKTTPAPSSDVNQYAQDVYEGKLKLTSVPSKIRAAVSRKVEELKNTRYSSEFDARVDYDQELKALDQAKNGGQIEGKPSDIINALADAYGKWVSKQEIEATIYNLFGVRR